MIKIFSISVTLNTMSLIPEPLLKKIKKERQDPTSFLPEEEMSYEIKKKKKKKKRKLEDPFKGTIFLCIVYCDHNMWLLNSQQLKGVILLIFSDVEEKMAKVREPDITALDPDIGMDPEVTIKVENIEVDLDFNDVSYKLRIHFNI